MKLRFSSVILSVLFILAILLITIQFISYEWLSEKINSATKDGNPESWNIDTFHQLKTNGLVIALLLLVVIGYLIYNLKSLKNWVDGLGIFVLDQFHNFLNVFKKNEFSTNVVILSIIFIGGLIRLFLYNDPITYDEAFSVNQYSTSSFANILSNYNYPNNHVFYNLINKLVGTFLGTQEWAIRLPAFIAGILCLPSLFVLGQQLYNNKQQAIFLVSLFAFSPILIEYSVLGRGYSLIWLLSIWSCSALLSYLKYQQSKYLTLFVIFNSLAIWTVPVAIIPLGTFMLFLAGRKKITIAIKLSTATLMGSIILYLPILLIYGMNITSKVSVGETESYSKLFTYHIAHGLLDFYYNFMMIKPVYFGFLIIILILAIFRNSKSKQWIFMAIISFTIVILIQKSLPPARVWSVLLLFLYIPLAEQLGSLFTNTKKNIIYFLPLSVLLIQFSINQKKAFMMNDFRYTNAEVIVSSISEPCTLVCQFPMEAPIQYYWKEFLRADQDFNVKSANTFIAVSTKHNQNINEICKQWDIDTTQVELIEEGKAYEMYQYKAQTK